MENNRKWTSKQLSAIGDRSGRLLVTASAGSGKTAVLTERIVRRIINDRISVDDLLVMTFTRAAASEMKERIRARLEAEKLYSQVAIIDSAHISTIDSFCADVVREHSDELGIDPMSRIAEEAELKLIKEDVIEILLESYYEKADEDFIDFVECFTRGNAGDGLKELIFDTYTFAQNSPSPEIWYAKACADFDTITSYIFENVRMQLPELCMDIDDMIDACNGPEGPQVYVEMLEDEKSQIMSAMDSSDYDSFNQRMQEINFARLKPDKKSNEDIRKSVQNQRKNVKAKIDKLCKLYCCDDLEEAIQRIEKTMTHVQTLTRMAADFGEAFAARKREKNILDFSDIEHMALKVLESGIYKGRFAEIYIDEYQDSNEVQEEIVRSMDTGNVFMVGDVKQSIYSFRQARPDIFRAKEKLFNDDASRGSVIALSDNFRSSREIVKNVNDIFNVIMSESFGGARYADLTVGEREGIEDGRARLMLVRCSEDDSADDRRSNEARMIGMKINELHDEGVPYKDIVILLRSGGVIGDIYADELNAMGIPAHMTGSKGYFDSLEVRTVLAALTAIDNPLKKIELTAFLKSPMIGLSDEDLAMGRTSEKAEDIIARYRAKAQYESIYELITELLDETGYYDYVTALPSGLTRKANLDKLKSMAHSYGDTGYKGLFNFIRYVEDLKDYDTDFGEASAIGESDDVVRIMTVHKSKGLEYPVCFVSAIDKEFNMKDTSGSILTDQDMGIACLDIDSKLRTSQSTLLRNAVALKKESEIRSEELRILYVALTRAKRELYITGSFKLKSGEDDASALKGRIYSADSWMEWICAAGSMTPEIISAHALVRDEEKRIRDIESLKDELRGITTDTETRDGYDRLWHYDYAYASDINLPAKVSISTLKHRDMVMSEESEGKVMFDYQETGDGAAPEQASRIGDDDRAHRSGVSGAARGSAYHEIMRILPHGKCSTLEDIEKLIAESSLTDEEKAAVDAKDILGFVESELGETFARAESEGRLYREAPFMMGLSAREIGEGDSDELILIQGIVDAYVEEDDGIILVDYKTDRTGSLNELDGMYRTQLKYYAKALEMMRQKPVKAMLIYSFTFGKNLVL